MLRAKYLLKEEHGIEALEEGEREKDMDLMEWVFETRMEIESADTNEELFEMLQNVEGDYARKIDEISRHFENGQYEEVKNELD